MLSVFIIKILILKCIDSFIQNTYTNATKLLTAAEELAHTGECAADEIYAVAQELERHVSSFATRVEQRRRRLDLAVVFYTHEKEVSIKNLTLVIL